MLTGLLFMARSRNISDKAESSALVAVLVYGVHGLEKVIDLDPAHWSFWPHVQQ